MIRRTVFLLAFAALAACTPDPPASNALDAEAKRFEAQPGMGAIYVVRSPIVYWLAPMSARIDDQPAVQIGRRDFARYDVAPGNHRILCGEADASYVVSVAAGQIAFVEAIADVGLVRPRCILSAMDPLNGRDRVSQGQRVAQRG